MAGSIAHSNVPKLFPTCPMSPARPRTTTTARPISADRIMFRRKLESIAQEFRRIRSFQRVAAQFVFQYGVQQRVAPGPTLPFMLAQVPLAPHPDLLQDPRRGQITRIAGGPDAVQANALEA